ncbi:MAG: CHASE2 domain-containing protein [Alphaproteobacteria bacterium]|nr:CHASE2 domain-containing protein [Alphaproteobacteria bacterium]
MHILLPLALLAAAVVLRIEEPAFFRQQQMWVFDLGNKLWPREFDTDGGVRIVDIDDESLEKFGQWPWPRTRMAEIIYRLQQAGALAIVFDIVFAEPDRTSPKNIVEIWPDIPDYKDLREQVRTMPDHDEAFAQTIKWTRNTVTGFALASGEAPRRPVQKGNFAFSGPDPRSFVYRFAGGIANLKPFEQAAAGNGNFNMVPEGDGIIRRVPLVVGYEMGGARADDRLYPSISLEALRVAQGARTMTIKSTGGSGETGFGEQTGIVSIKVGRKVVPTDGEGRIWVQYTGHRTERFVPVWKVLDESVDKSLLDGHIVLIGTSAAGLLDLRSTPLDPALPGVEVHAEIIEQVLKEQFLSRPDWSKGAEIAYIIAVGLLLTFLLPRFGALWCAMAGAASVFAIVGGSVHAYREYKLLLDPVYPSIAVLGVYLSASLISYIRTEAERRQVRGAFSQYLSPALVDQLAENPDQLQLGGETKPMTFLFCDVRGFTAISETFKSNPQGLTKLINRLLTPLTNVILARKGTIDKYMGDCIMAFWNAPLDDEEHAIHACESSLAMFKALDVLNEERRLEAEAEGVPFLPLNVGAGINTGECVVGNMGSEQRFDYSVLGDPVNLAARLESQSKNYGVKIVIGPETAKAAEGKYALLKLDLIQVKGQSVGVEICGLQGDADYAASPEFVAIKDKHDAMLEAYYAQDWDKAVARIAECRALTNGEMPELYDLYDERIAEFRENPPPEDWDGVFVATTK